MSQRHSLDVQPCPVARWAGDRDRVQGRDLTSNLPLTRNVYHSRPLELLIRCLRNQCTCFFILHRPMLHNRSGAFRADLRTSGWKWLLPLEMHVCENAPGVQVMSCSSWIAAGRYATMCNNLGCPRYQTWQLRSFVVQSGTEMSMLQVGVGHLSIPYCFIVAINSL